VMLSRDAVQDIHKNFPLAICGHVCPPCIRVATLHSTIQHCKARSYSTHFDDDVKPTAATAALQGESAHWFDGTPDGKRTRGILEKVASSASGLGRYSRRSSIKAAVRCRSQQSLQLPLRRWLRRYWFGSPAGAWWPRTQADYTNTGSLVLV
jgi:hypothetical protein